MNKDIILKRAAKEVDYELEMFYRIYDSFKITGLTDNQFKRNLLIETFAIHVYCLFRFFYQGEIEKKNKYKRPRNKTDIIAEDFIVNRKKFREERAAKKDLKIIEVKRNKQIAHLTYNRIYRNSKTKPWNIKVIFKKMDKTVLAFSDALPEENKKMFNFLHNIPRW